MTARRVPESARAARAEVETALDAAGWSSRRDDGAPSNGSPRRGELAAPAPTEDAR